MKVAVLMPTWGRAAQFKRNAELLFQTALPDGYELALVCSVPVDDAETAAVMERLEKKSGGVKVVWLEREAQQTAVDGWNQAYEYAFADDYDWFVLGADDIEWDPRWLCEAAKVIETSKANVIGLNDGYTDLEKYAPHYVMSRAHAAWFGFIPDGYKSWWFDREVCESAQALGQYAPAWEARAIHHHPDWGLAAVDNTYKSGMYYRDIDRAYYFERKKLGFPVDYEVWA